MTKAIKITQAQAEALADAVKMYAQAQAPFEEWCMRSSFCNVGTVPFKGTFEDWLVNNYGWIAKRDRPNDVDGYIAERVKRLRHYYEMYRSGVVEINTSSSTLRALERKGLIEVIHDGKRFEDTIRLLYV